MSRIPKEPVKLVTVPSPNKIPERDIDKSPILECQHLGIDFGGLSAVKDFNMAIGRTEIAGLIGPNGAGKTTVFNLLTKVYHPTRGTILLDGHDTAGLNTIQVNKLSLIHIYENSEVRTNVFRSCFIDPFQGEKMADYAYNKLGARTAGILFETGNDYSEGLKDAFVKKAAELGLEVVATEAFATGDKDYKAQMTNIASKNPDVVFCPIYYGEAGLAITQGRQAGITATFLGGDGFGGIRDYASPEDLEGTVYCSGYAPGTESVAQFEADYQATYGEPVPNMFAPLAYDAAMLIDVYKRQLRRLTGQADIRRTINLPKICTLHAIASQRNYKPW